jgi:signal recognition particle subunit SRP54
VILTKLDGDTRGGAALSVKAVTGKPVKFASTGEKITDLEPFHPDRMASRILGMGDMLSLIEKAQESFDGKKAAELEERMRSQRFTMDDYLEQLGQLKKMGGLDALIGMMPGLDAKALKGAQVDERKLVRTEAIIHSMTKKERADPSIIDFSRRKRIAAGSGTTIQEINALLRSFEDMRKMMKQFMGGGKRPKMPGGMRFPR